MARAHREDDAHLVIFCPGCNEAHVTDQRWKFNGNFDAPTFTPSLHCRTGHYVTGQSIADCNICQNEPTLRCRVCHSFITDGRIQFLGDSTRALAGQTVPLPDWRGFDPASYRE